MLSLFKLEQWFLNFCLCVCVWCVSHSVMSDFLQPYRLYPLQAPLCMEFSRQEYRSGLSFPSPGDLSDPGIEPGSPALQANSLSSEPSGKPILCMCVSLSVICLTDETIISLQNSWKYCQGLSFPELFESNLPTLCPVTLSHVYNISYKAILP